MGKRGSVSSMTLEEPCVTYEIVLITPVILVTGVLMHAIHFQVSQVLEWRGEHTCRRQGLTFNGT